MVLTILSTLLLLSSCKKDNDNTAEIDSELEAVIHAASNGAGKSFFQFPSSDDLDNIPQDVLNPLTTEKVELGKLLYHETGLGLSPMSDIGEQTFSCASCHFASAGFQAGRFQGIAEGGIGFGLNGEDRTKGALYAEADIDVQPIRTPSTLNVAYQTNMLWNGQFGATGVNVGTQSQWTVGTPLEENFLGFEGTEIQAIAGSGVHRLDADSAFLASAGYMPMFDEAFSDVPKEERYSLQNMGLAIAAYERTLLANEAPFQRWLKGDNNALTIDEKLGAILFFDEAGCASCHSGPALNTMEFHALGMKDLFACPEPTFKSSESSKENLGRGGFTGNADDNYKFKVPQLYNLTDSPFYGHGSSFRSVRDVIAYKNNAVAENSNVPNSQLASEFVPLNLTSVEIDQLTAFIENGLRDPNLKRFEPESILSGFCFPNNDPKSRDDLGCD